MNTNSRQEDLLGQSVTVECLTNAGKRGYCIDNSGQTDVATELQAMFNDVADIPDVSATFSFAPGEYYINAPLIIRLPSVRLQGHAHGGLDIHGLNLSGGSILQFGPDCGPNCITFEYTGRQRAFPSGEEPWPYKSLRIDIDKLTFVGYNNTDVDTANGYSRFREDEPNFRGLRWYPAEGRYTDIEVQGQRALVIPKNQPGEKAEMLRINGCYFTDVFVGIDVATCDVSYITQSWFAQLVYGVRYHGAGQCMFISDNCFADLQTALQLAHPTMSAIHDNGFAYVSKCLDIGRMEHSSITGNVLKNWEKSTGAAAYGAFCYLGGPSSNITMTGNSLRQNIDSRAKTITIDPVPNGRSFLHFEDCDRLQLSNNVINTIQSQTAVRLHNCRQSVVTDNIITYADGGNAVAQTGQCRDNFYRPIRPEDSAPFDDFVY